jgi:catalase
MVDAVRGVFGGCYPGYRAAHARGTVVKGTFTPTGIARELTSAEFMRAGIKGPIEVTVRFSNASGDPSKPDNKRDTRGMAVRFHPPGGATMDIVAVTLPCFLAKDPEEFFALQRATRRAGHLPAKLSRIIPFMVAHLGNLKKYAAAFKRPVPSYANCRFNALHTFIWRDPHEIRRYVRYSWRPAEGEAHLSHRVARRLPRDYLYRDLYDRLARRPPRAIRFTLEIQLASEDDVRQHRINDPTAEWPKTRDRIVPATLEHVDDPNKNKKRERFLSAGVLEITELADSAEQLMFNPMPHVPGVEASDDPILRARPPAYAVSVDQRTEPNCGKPASGQS